MKYVIMDCPACMEVIETDCAHTYCCTDNHNANCKNIPDCLLKRIVELCKKEPQNIMLISNGCAYGIEENKAFCLAQDILKLLEIEVAE